MNCRTADVALVKKIIQVCVSNGNIRTKTLALKFLFNKVADLQACIFEFSCEYCEIFKNTYFKEHLRTAASGDSDI